MKQARVGQPRFQWTIARKIGGLTAVLILFILSLLLYSIVTLRGIQSELQEVAELDVPLTELTNRIEIEQLEQQITIDRMLRLGQGAEAAQHVEQLTELRARLEGHSRAMTVHTEEGLALSAVGTGTAFPAVFQQVHKTLEEIKGDAARLHEAMFALADTLTSGAEPAVGDIDTVLAMEIAVDEKMLALIGTIEKFTNREIEVLQNHERIFFLVNTALGAAGVLLGVILSTLVIVSIRTKLFRLKQLVTDVSQAIEENRDLPASSNLAASSDEIGELTKGVTDLVGNIETDFQKREELSRHLKTIATTDALTGAFNRLKWDEDLVLEIERVRRGGEALSVIALDIDFFKRINDTFGHGVGDRVLAEMVAVTQGEIRKIDSLYRIGGEEFVVLAPQTNSAQAEVLAEKLRAKVGGRSFKDVGPVTLSIGVAQFKPEQDEDGSLMLKDADAALYRAKEGGRNRVCVAADVE